MEVNRLRECLTKTKQENTNHLLEYGNGFLL